MNELAKLCLLETIVGLFITAILVSSSIRPINAFSTCMVMFLFGWINYEIGKEIKS